MAAGALAGMLGLDLLRRGAEVAAVEASPAIVDPFAFQYARIVATMGGSGHGAIIQIQASDDRESWYDVEQSPDCQIDLGDGPQPLRVLATGRLVDDSDVPASIAVSALTP